MRSTPVPHMLDLAPMYGYGFSRVHVKCHIFYSKPISGALVVLPVTYRMEVRPFYLRFQQLYDEQRNSPSHTTISRFFLAGYAGRNPMEAPRRVPPFPGAAIAFEPSGNSRGSVQLIRTDRGDHVCWLSG